VRGARCGVAARRAAWLTLAALLAVLGSPDPFAQDSDLVSGSEAGFVRFRRTPQGILRQLQSFETRSTLFVDHVSTRASAPPGS